MHPAGNAAEPSQALTDAQTSLVLVYYQVGGPEPEIVSRLHHSLPAAMSSHNLIRTSTQALPAGYDRVMTEHPPPMLVLLDRPIP